MIQETLETRVARLEEQVSSLAKGRIESTQPTPSDWKETVGMFRGDSIVQEMIEHSRRVREEERRQAHSESKESQS